MAVESQELGGLYAHNILRLPPSMEGRKTCAEDDCTMLAQNGDYCGGNICITIMGVVGRLH